MPFRLRGADMRNLADEDLMALVDDGEVRAFEVIFDRHAGAGYSLAVTSRSPVMIAILSW